MTNSIKVPEDLLTGEINEELYEKYKEEREYGGTDAPYIDGRHASIFNILEPIMKTRTYGGWYGNRTDVSKIYSSVDEFLADIKSEFESYLSKCVPYSYNSTDMTDAKMKFYLENEFMYVEEHGDIDINKIHVKMYRDETFEEFKKRVQKLRKDHEKKRLTAEKNREKTRISNEKK